MPKKGLLQGNAKRREIRGTPYILREPEPEDDQEVGVQEVLPKYANQQAPGCIHRSRRHEDQDEKWNSSGAASSLSWGTWDHNSVRNTYQGSWNREY